MSYLRRRLVVAAVACERGFLRKMIEISILSQKLDVTAVNYLLRRRLYDDLGRHAGSASSDGLLPKKESSGDDHFYV